MTQSLYVPQLPLTTIYMHGEQHLQYLQGQLTQDVLRLDEAHAQRACHCDAKGKMWSDLLLLPWQQGIVAVLPESAAEKSIAELKKYGVFSKISFSTPAETFSLSYAQGEQSISVLTGLFSQLPQQALECVALGDNRLLRLEGDLPRFLLWAEDTISQQVAAALPLGSANDWQVSEIQQQIAHIATQTQAEFVPQQLNMQALNAISFTKGCYMGQETVARTKYLGRNKRAAYLLHCDTALALEPGAELEVQLGENWRRSGTVLNCATLGESSWALAVLPNDTEIGAVLRSKDHPSALFTVQPHQYTLENE